VIPRLAEDPFLWELYLPDGTRRVAYTLAEFAALALVLEARHVGGRQIRIVCWRKSEYVA